MEEPERSIGGSMIKLQNWRVSKQIASWLYLDGHPCTEPMKSKPIDKEFLRELVGRLSRN